MNKLYILLLLFFINSCTTRETASRSPSQAIRPYNVCSVTINSPEEINTFKNRLSSQSFQFHELTENKFEDDQKNQDKMSWLNSSCESKTKCDSLIISGHYGGQFFGNNPNYYLNPRDLLKLKCNNKCGNILNEPLEVFLMGCNTLSSRESDGRSPQQYFDALLEHGYTTEQAAQVVLERYSPFGISNKEMFTRIFSQTKHIYGFYSIAPTGKQVQYNIQSYVKQNSPYELWMNKLENEKEISGKSSNINLSSNMKGFNFIETAGISSELKDDNLMDSFCALTDNTQTTFEKKLTLVKNLVSGSNLSDYKFLIKEIIDFVELYSKDPVASKKISEVLNQEKFKQDMISNIDTTNFYPLKLRLISYALGLKILNHENSSKQVLAITSPLFKSSKMSQINSSFICVMDAVILDIIGKSFSYDMLQDGALEDEETLKALSCIKPKDENILKKMPDLFDHANEKIRKYADTVYYYSYTNSAKALKPIITKVAEQKTVSNNVYFRNYFYNLLNKKLTVETYNDIMNMANTANTAVKKEMLRVIVINKPTDKSVLARLKKEFNINLK